MKIKVKSLKIEGYEIEFGWAYGEGIVNGRKFDISVNHDDKIYVSWADGSPIFEPLEQFLISEVRKDFPTLVSGLPLTQ
jgi:hypothetical protein